MARGRFLSKNISLDAKVANLSSPLVQLLWTWMIPHIDATGHFYGEASIVRGLVFPRQQVSTDEVDNYLDEMHEAALLVRYEVDGEQYLYFPNFAKHQVGLRADREAASGIPPWSGEAPEDSRDDVGPTPDEVPTTAGAMPDLIPPNVKNKFKSKGEEEVKKSESDFLSQTPPSQRERIRNVLVDVLADGHIPETDYLLESFTRGVDTLVVEFRQIWGKKRLDDDLTSKIVAAIRSAYEDEDNWQFNKVNEPNRAVIGCIVAQGRKDKDKAAARDEWHAAAELSQAALAARQANPPEKPDPWWSEKLADLHGQMTNDTFDTWLRNTRLLERKDGRIVIGVANKYAKDWVKNRLLAPIKRAVAPDGVEKVEFEVIGSG